MHEQPREPREQPRELHATHHGDGLVPTDGGQITLVEILEGRTGLATQRPGDVRPHQCAHLIRGRRHRRHGASVGCDRRRDVASAVDVRIARHTEIIGHGHASGAIHRDAQLAPQR